MGTCRGAYPTAEAEHDREPHADAPPPGASLTLLVDPLLVKARPRPSNTPQVAENDRSHLPNFDFLELLHGVRGSRETVGDATQHPVVDLLVEVQLR